jgi:hypothetical protein
MSAELVAVEGLTLKFSNPLYTGTIVIGPGPVIWLPDVTKVIGKKIALSIPFTVTGFVGGGISSGTGAGVLSAIGKKAAVQTLPPVTLEDSVTILITDTVTPFGTLNVDVVIDDPAQSVVKVAA